MITYIDKNNAAQYTALFRKAELALTLPEKTISTLEQYFYYLPDLMQLKKEGSEYGETLGRRYAMLPVDEEVFFIDANTRQISVPTSFKRNGIAVQGDEVAEIVYFKINRYFDFMDLNNTEIYIQYEDPKGNKDVCQEWVRDIESDPDFLIFGWALRDPITKYDGTLKFSVRFVNWDDDDGTMIYNFSTTETSAAINKGLNITIDAERAESENDDINQMILKRTRKSLVVGADKANIPEYHLTLEDWVKQNEGSEEYVYSVDLAADGTYLFKVQAYSTDAGNIDYSWRKGDEVLPNTPLYERVPYDVVDGEETDYVTAKSGHIYYIANGEGYTILSNVNPGDQIKQECYELYGSYTANIAGVYRAVATNKLKYDEAAKSTKEITIPFPVEAGCAPNGGQGTDYILLPVYEYKVNIITSPVNNDTPDSVEKYSYEYQWYKDGKEEGNKIAGATQKDYQVTGNAEFSNVQGKYYLETTAVRNNARVKSFSNPFLVTYTAETISSVDLTDQDGVSIVSNAYGGDVLYVKPVFEKNYQLLSPEYHYFDYQWCTVKGDDNLTTPIPDATGPSLYLTPQNEEGSLVGKRVCCLVTNHYNGTSTPGQSAIISINEA